MRIDTAPGWPNRFVGKNGHLAREGIRGAEGFECIDYAVIHVRCVKLVLAVVVEEELQGHVKKMLVFGIAQSTTNQHGGAIANVRGNHLQWQFMPSKVAEHRIHRISQVLPGVNQSSIKVEDQEPQLANWDFTINLHFSQFICGSESR